MVPGRRITRLAATSITMSVFSAALHAQATEQWQLTPTVGSSTQRFGFSMAVEGDVLAVGAPHDDTNGSDAGTVDVYRWDASTSTYLLEQQLFPSDPEDGAQFGASVDQSGDVLVVGAPYKDTTRGADGGQIYVFRYSSTSLTWSQEQKIVPSVGVANDHFGASVALSGTLALAGAPHADTALGTDSGVVIAYRYKNSFLKWVEEKVLVDNDGAAYDNAGTSILVDGSTAFVGSPLSYEATNSSAGSVAIWSVSGSTWTQGAELTAPTPQDYGSFGSRLRLSGDLLAITAPSEDETTTILDSGAVYLFRSVSGSYTLERRFAAPTPTAYAYFGTDVAVDQKLVVVGCQVEDVLGQNDCGTAFLFREGKKPGWIYDGQLVASDLANLDHLGVQVALASDAILVAADGNDTTAGSDWGVIYGYDRDEISLSITPPDPLPAETMTISAFRGATGGICMITVEDVDGTPLFLPLIVYVFAADNTFTFNADAPSPLFGVSLGLRAYKISSTGAVVASDLVFTDV